MVSYQRGDLSPDFVRTHQLDAPFGTPYAIAYAFEEAPHVYLPDYVGTLAGGGLLVAEAGRVEEKTREQARAKLEAARALVALKGGALWIGTDENLSGRRQHNLIFLHARSLTFPAFAELAEEIGVLWQSHLLEGHRSIAPVPSDSTAEAHIFWRHVQLALFTSQRGPQPNHSWAERPLTMLVALNRFFLTRQSTIWDELRPK